jgi:hypothetical protein
VYVCVCVCVCGDSAETTLEVWRTTVERERKE